MIAIKGRLSISTALLLLPTLLWAKVEVLSIQGVSIDTSECLTASAEAIEFACHRFAKGSGLAIALRHYWPQKHGDDDAFEKLTIVFKNQPRDSQTINLPNKDVFVFYSSGPSSFPGKHGCYGTPAGGSISVLSRSAKVIKLKVSLDMDLKSPLNWAGECVKSKISMTLKAKPFSFNKLNSWYGLANNSGGLWEEAHPQRPER